MLLLVKLAPLHGSCYHVNVSMRSCCKAFACYYGGKGGLYVSADQHKLDLQMLQTCWFYKNICCTWMRCHSEGETSTDILENKQGSGPHGPELDSPG